MARLALGNGLTFTDATTQDTGAPKEFMWTFSTTTTAPPSSGEIRFNNATYASVTNIYVHDTDANGESIVGSPDGLVLRAAQTRILLKSRENLSRWVLFAYSSTATYNGSTYYTIPVAHISSGGAVMSTGTRNTYFRLDEQGASPTASSITLVDTGNYFTTDNVEAALQELAAAGGGSTDIATVWALS